MNGFPDWAPRSRPDGGVTNLNLVMELLQSCSLTCNIDDQKMDFGPSLVAVQKDLSW
jgi:hypothetical protein